MVCCPPPLFHCFGLVAGLLASFTHGASIIYPSRDFDPEAITDALLDEGCTVLHGVPTMFTAILGVLQTQGRKISTIRTGIVAGSKVPPPLLQELRHRMGFRDTAICFGRYFGTRTFETKRTVSGGAALRFAIPLRAARLTIG